MQRGGGASILKLELNASLGVPLYKQVMNGIQELLAAGELRPGDQLPSIRELAAQLRINPSSAVKAYGELEHEGVITMDQEGTFIRKDVGVVAESRHDLLDHALDALFQRAHTLGISDKELVAAVVARAGKPGVRRSR